MYQNFKGLELARSDMYPSECGCVVMCGDVNDVLNYVVYTFRSKNYQPIFVWGVSNQYYMVNTCMWQRHTSTFNNLYFVWMCLPKCIHVFIISNIC